MLFVLRTDRQQYASDLQNAHCATKAVSCMQEAARAESNVRFLSALREPCTRLAAVRLGDVPGLLPGILDVLRMIWTLSPHHADADAIAALLRKVGAACGTTAAILGVSQACGWCGADGVVSVELHHAPSLTGAGCPCCTRQVSNGVISRCRHHVDLAALFAGEKLEAVEQALQQRCVCAVAI